MLQHLTVLLLALGLCQAHIMHVRLEEPEVLPGFRPRVISSSAGQAMLGSMHSPINELPALAQPILSMSRSSNGDWDSWMDSQFDALNAMNQALLGRRGGCGGHMTQQTFGPILIRGVPTMTTPAVVMQRLASARFGNDLLKDLIEEAMEAETRAPGEEMNVDVDMLVDQSMPSEPEEIVDDEDEADTEYVSLDDEDAEELGWDQGERMLNQADEDEEAEAEDDATEDEQGQWSSFLPSWITQPEDQELMNDPAASTSAINWSFQNDDGSANWGLIVFIIQATACVSVWAGLMATLGYYRYSCRQAASSVRRQQFATAGDSHLMTPLMYEPVSKSDHTAQLYGDLYPVEDAKLHADDREYVAIQYVPLKSEV